MRHDACLNTSGGIFVPGAASSYTKKLEITAAYCHGMQQNPPPLVASIAIKCTVSRPFVDRIVEELGI